MCSSVIAKLRYLGDPVHLGMLRHKELVDAVTARVESKRSAFGTQSIYVFSCLAANIFLQCVSCIMFLIEAQCSLLELLTDKVYWP